MTVDVLLKMSVILLSYNTGKWNVRSNFYFEYKQIVEHIVKEWNFIAVITKVVFCTMIYQF